MVTTKNSILVDMIEPICAAHGVELVDVMHARKSGRHGGVVRVMIDRPPASKTASIGSGVTLADCQGVSRDVSAILDLHPEVINGAFHLEVTSPGLDRPLVRPKDFVRFVGQEIKVQLKTPVTDRRNWQGTLHAASEQGIALDVGAQTLALAFDNIARAHVIAKLR